MAIPHPARGRRIDADGVVQLDAPRQGGSAWLVGAAVAFTLACIGLSAWLAQEPVGSQESAPPVGASEAMADEGRVRHLRPQSARHLGPTAPPASPPAPEATPEPAPEEAAFAMASDPTNEPSGIALFPAPGTKPLKRGILVPEDFELPPGYVRHYQATDNGERVPAILMFHPDYQPRDAQGEPLPLPEDRIVPPELAPPGLPIRMLQLPGEDGAEPGP